MRKGCSKKSRAGSKKRVVEEEFGFD